MPSIARLIAVVSLTLIGGCGEKLVGSPGTGRGDADTQTDADAGDVIETQPDAGDAGDAGGGCASGLFFSDGGCAPGCLNDSACPSGICLASHDCFSCQNDQQCADRRACGTGTCNAVCVTEAPCPVGWSCCGGRCVDPSSDARHCGGCAACNTGAFCGLGHCIPAVVSNVCQQPVVRVVLDGQAIDDEAGKSIGAALAGACGSAVTLVIGATSDAGVFDVITGEPLRTGELLVMGGGAYTQKPVAWLEDHSFIPVVDTSTASELRYTQRDGGVVCTFPLTTISLTHDVFVVELATAPSGSVVLSAAGYFGPGTTAAAWYVVKRMAPSLASQTKGWYVVEWTDNLNGGTVGLPDELDTWALLASGL